jgi:biopolymer transport protein ExbD
MPMEPVVVPLSASQRGKIRRLAEPKELSPDEEGGELNIVPFLDIIMNILIFVLATVSVTFTATIETQPPAQGGAGVRKPVESSALNLTVLIVNDGFSIKAAGGNVAPGCERAGPGVTIAKAGAEYDFDALNKCVARLKKSNPAFADENQISIGANPGTPYQIIVSVMDAVRANAAGDTLFDDVNFKVPR